MLYSVKNPHSATLKMEATCFSKMVYFYQVTAALPITSNLHTVFRVDVFSGVFDRWCPTFRSNFLTPSTGFIQLLIFRLHGTYIWRLTLIFHLHMRTLR